MRISAQNPDAANYLVLLNSKPCLGAIEADSIEGWVDIWDPSRLAPLDLEDETEVIPEQDAPPVVVAVPTKRIYGKVEIVPIKK